MATTDILPFATGGGANVESQALFAADPTTGTGFLSGTASSLKLNKVWRQSSFMAAVIANWEISMGYNVPDDGNLANAVANFGNALKSLIELNQGQYYLDTGLANAYVIALSPPITSYTNGLNVSFKVTHANTGASTLNAGGGVVALVNDIGIALISGDLPLSTILSATYDSVTTSFIINNVVTSQYLNAAQFQSASAIAVVATGTADAITGTFTPIIASLTNGMSLTVRAILANTSTTPTFQANSTAVKTIVKGNNLPLVAGDIAGAGHWIELQYDLTLDKWVLQNPASGINGFASTAESQAQTVANKYLSPATLALALQGANQSLTANGYQKFPGGLIVQWGSQAITTTQTNYNFPIAFPTAALKILLADGDAVAAAQTFGAHVVSATQYSAICSGASVLASYIAIGF